MFCLLCYESNADYICLSSEESEYFKVSSVLFKYFKFIFEVTTEGTTKGVYNTLTHFYQITFRLNKIGLHKIFTNPTRVNHGAVVFVENVG